MHHLSHTFTARWVELHVAIGTPTDHDCRCKLQSIHQPIWTISPREIDLWFQTISHIIASISVFIQMCCSTIHMQESIELYKMTYFYLPTRIRQKWLKLGNRVARYGISRALQGANVPAQEFRKCWDRVKDSIPEKELLLLCKKAKGSFAGRVNFVKAVVRRHKAMGESVCLFGMPIFFFSVFFLWVRLVTLLCICGVTCTPMHNSLHSANLYVALVSIPISRVNQICYTLITQSEWCRKENSIFGSRASLIHITTVTSIVAHQNILPKHIQTSKIAFEMSMSVPGRIRERLRKNGARAGQIVLTEALWKSKITAENFKQYWAVTHPTISDDKLFGLFKKAFGERRNQKGLAGKMSFIRDISRRYKAMGEPVRLSGTPVLCLFTFLSALWVHFVMLLCRCVVSCALMYDLSHTFTARWVELHATFALTLITGVYAKYKSIDCKVSCTHMTIIASISVHRNILLNNMYVEINQNFRVHSKVANTHSSKMVWNLW